MLMLFKNDANILNLKQALYNLLKKDKDAIDKIFNLIYANRFIKKVPFK
jgi:hypothetical protein